jgi:hypothetical protein
MTRRRGKESHLLSLTIHGGTNNKEILMFKKFLSFVLVGLLMQAGFSQPVAASTKPEKEAQFVEKVKAGIAKLGTGMDARVEVKLRDKRKLKGYVGEAGAESFTVVDAKTGAATEVAYPQVQGVKGNNLSGGARVATGFGIAAAVVVITLVALSD